MEEGHYIMEDGKTGVHVATHAESTRDNDRLQLHAQSHHFHGNGLWTGSRRP